MVNTSCFLYALHMLSGIVDLCQNIAINKTASYFGDPVLRRSQIRRIVNDQFEDEHEIDGDILIMCTENVVRMTSHPLMFAFTAGAGTARYGFAQ
jgi:hypothetical protein